MNDVFASIASHHNVSCPTAISGAEVRAAFEAELPTPSQSRLVRYALMEMEPGQLVEVRRNCAMAIEAVGAVASRCLPEDDDLLELLHEFRIIEMARTVRRGVTDYR